MVEGDLGRVDSPFKRGRTPEVQTSGVRPPLLNGLLLLGTEDWLSILHIGVEPAHHFVKQLLIGLPS